MLFRSQPQRVKLQNRIECGWRRVRGPVSAHENDLIAIRNLLGCALEMARQVEIGSKGGEGWKFSRRLEIGGWDDWHCCCHLLAPNAFDTTRPTRRCADRVTATASAKRRGDKARVLTTHVDRSPGLPVQKSSVNVLKLFGRVSCGSGWSVPCVSIQLTLAQAIGLSSTWLDEFRTETGFLSIRSQLRASVFLSHTR